LRHYEWLLWLRRLRGIYLKRRIRAIRGLIRGPYYISRTTTDDEYQYKHNTYNMGII